MTNVCICTARFSSVPHTLLQLSQNQLLPPAEVLDQLVYIMQNFKMQQEIPFFRLGLFLESFFLLRLLRLFEPSEMETLLMLPLSKSLSTSGSSSSLCTHEKQTFNFPAFKLSARRTRFSGGCGECPYRGAFPLAVEAS